MEAPCDHLEAPWKPFGTFWNPFETFWEPLGSLLGPLKTPWKPSGNPWQPPGSLLQPLGSALGSLWDRLEAQREPLGPIGNTIRGQTETQGIQKDAKGRPREAKRELGWPFWGPWGASLAKDDFGSKTSKLAEAFDENCREGPQRGNGVQKNHVILTGVQKNTLALV